MSMTTAEFAAAVDSTPREVRKFLRSEDLGVGRGTRYAIDGRKVKALSKRFAAWDAARKVADAAKVDDAPAPEGDDATIDA